MRFGTIKKGFSVIEVLVASAVISLSIIYISNIYGGLVVASTSNTPKIQAAFLLDEGVEAIKTMRGERWANIASTTPGTTYYFYWNSSANKWQATTTPSQIDSFFTRTFVTSSVYRDASTLNIQTTGTLDTGTRKVDITVAWLEKGSTTTRTTSMYIFNIYE